MGSAASKAARSTSGAASRKYPTRQPNSAPPTPASALRFQKPGSASQHGQLQRNESITRMRAQVSGSKNAAIAEDARDPDFDARLREVGPVQPNPTFSPSSVSQTQPSRSSSSSPHTPGVGQSVYPSPSANPAIAILTARQRIQDEAERERTQLGQPGFQGKSLIDIHSIRRILAMRDEQGVEPEEIERMLQLKPGTVAKLGRPGAVEAA